MAVCGRCHKDWPDQYWVCPEDGTVLTAARTASGQIITTPLGIPREEDLRAGTMVGEYRVEGKLGEGGMGTVYAAIHPLIGKKVAIKVMSRAAVRRSACGRALHPARRAPSTRSAIRTSSTSSPSARCPTGAATS